MHSCSHKQHTYKKWKCDRNCEVTEREESKSGGGVWKERRKSISQSEWKNVRKAVVICKACNARPSILHSHYMTLADLTSLYTHPMLFSLLLTLFTYSLILVRVNQTTERRATIDCLDGLCMCAIVCLREKQQQIWIYRRPFQLGYILFVHHSRQELMQHTNGFA